MILKKRGIVMHHDNRGCDAGPMACMDQAHWSMGGLTTVERDKGIGVSDLDEEITRMTAAWMTYVNKDHHKDRDCHWWIEKMWSCGDPPKYRANHEGYIGGRIDTPWRETNHVATLDLREALAEEIAHAVGWAKGRIAKPEEDWLSDRDPQEILTIFEEWSK